MNNCGWININSKVKRKAMKIAIIITLAFIILSVIIVFSGSRDMNPKKIALAIFYCMAACLVCFFASYHLLKDYYITQMLFESNNCIEKETTVGYKGEDVKTLDQEILLDKHCVKEEE